MPLNRKLRMGGCLTICSPFGNVIELFDNKDSFPDLKFVIPGLKDALNLHRGIVGQRSKLVQGLLKAKEAANSTDANKIEWVFDTSKEVDRAALVKGLRFCYGETLSVNAQQGECCAVIAALFRLQLTCLDDIVPQLVEYTVNQAKKDPLLGTKLVMETQFYPECCAPNTCEVDKALAKVVFTAENICQNYEAVVKGCLMKLPMEYLDMVEYGKPHTLYSEFALRTLYVKEHDKILSRDEKQILLSKCDWTKLRSGELITLRELEIVGQDVMTEASDKVLESTEKERKEYKDRAVKAEKERDEAMKESKSSDVPHHVMK